jgi:histidinol-phosphate phosphatase family protein
LTLVYQKTMNEHKNILADIDESWSIFLDRDGVLNKKLDNDYVKSWEEFVWIEGSLHAVVELKKHFNRVFIVTNQQGVGKGLMTEEDLHTVHAKMLENIQEAGGDLDAIYYCPNLASEGNPCRKPDIGMALKAKQDFPEIDLKKSILLGDSISDLEFARNAGMKSIHISSASDTNLTNLSTTNLASAASILCRNCILGKQDTQ